MFNSKKSSLFGSKTQTSGTTNSFVAAGMKKSARTLSGNGAVKYSTTGNDWVDQFGKLGSYKAPRSFEDVSKDMSILFAQNKYLAICFALYIRLVTRITGLWNGDKTATVQRGAGLRHEAILRFIWLGVYHKDLFYKNLGLLIQVGSWKDIIYMLQYDLIYNGWKGRVLDWQFIGQFITAGLENPNTSNLVKKYLPQIKSNNQCKTVESQADNMIGKWICSILFGCKEDDYGYYRKYRKLKSSGTAHEWQKLISQRKFLQINFNTVAGRALSLLVSGKFLQNNNLEAQYQKWIEAKPVAKFTGYPHELFKSMRNLKKYQIDTLNKQFAMLVQTAQKNAIQGTSMIVVRDTSGSMSSVAAGTTQSCYDIGKALALFFSEMLPEGHFANSWIEFNNTAKMHQWKGSTPYEKWMNDNSNFIGGTDFQSVIKLFVNIKQKGVAESEFPTGIICISDSEFNPAQLGKTNVQTALKTLRNGGFSEDYINNFKIVLWNLQSNYYGRGTGEKFETHGAVKNVYYFSGYDASVIAFLTGTKNQKSEPKTAEELFEAAMDQEILKMVEI